MNPQISKSKAVLDHFVATQETREAHRLLEEDECALEQCVSRLYLQVLDEGCREAAELAAKELLSVRVGAQRLLETLLVKVGNAVGGWAVMKVVMMMMMMMIVLDGDEAVFIKLKFFFVWHCLRLFQTVSVRTE